MSKAVVWIVNHYVPPPGAAGSVRHQSLAESISDDSTVVLFGARVGHTYNTGTARGGFRTEHGDVTYYWLPAIPGKRTHQRVLGMVTFAISLIISAPVVAWRSGRPNTIVGTNAHLLAAFSSLLLAKLMRARFIYEARDIWPETLFAFGVVGRESIVGRILRAMEVACNTQASTVLSPLPKYAEYVHAQGWQTKTVWIPQISAATGQRACVREACRSFVYVGAIGPSNRLDVLLEAWAISERPPDAQFDIYGSGPLRSHLEGTCAAIPGATFKGVLPRGSVSRTLAQYDAAMIAVDWRPELYRWGIAMNKLADYCTVGLPTLLAGPVSTEYIEAGGGYWVQSHDPKQVAVGISALLNSALPTRRRMNQVAYEYAKKYHTRTAAGEMFRQVVLEESP